MGRSACASITHEVGGRWKAVRRRRQTGRRRTRGARRRARAVGSAAAQGAPSRRGSASARASAHPTVTRYDGDVGVSIPHAHLSADVHVLVRDQSSAPRGGCRRPRRERVGERTVGVCWNECLLRAARRALRVATVVAWGPQRVPGGCPTACAGSCTQGVGTQIASARGGSKPQGAYIVQGWPHTNASRAPSAYAQEQSQPAFTEVLTAQFGCVGNWCSSGTGGKWSVRRAACQGGGQRARGRLWPASVPPTQLAPLQRALVGRQAVCAWVHVP